MRFFFVFFLWLCICTYTSAQGLRSPKIRDPEQEVTESDILADPYNIKSMQLEKNKTYESYEETQNPILIEEVTSYQPVHSPSASPSSVLPQIELSNDEIEPITIG